MKLVLTGASGFVGRQLIKRLTEAGHQVLAIGRKAPARGSENTKVQWATYEDLPASAGGYDRVLHLAAVNTTSDESRETFFKVNAELPVKLAEEAKAAGVPLFVNFSSFHGLEGGPDTAYAASKRAGAEALAARDGIKVCNLYLPAVYGDAYAGKLAVLNRVPAFLGPLFFKVLSALAPTVHIGRIADFVAQDVQNLPVDEPVLLADDQDKNGLYRFGRKLIDVGFALAVILVFWWLLLIVWVLVKTGSDGPGIFAQERVGKGGKVFTCYKFRTMGKDTRQAGTHEISESAVTPIGAFLRKTKIDELPQVWNILKGELSLVGPRPCLPVQEELVEERKKRGVLDVLPGITGFAQIQGIDMSHPVRLARKDAEYIARRGLLFDLKIILGTFIGKGQGDRTAK
ncbi:sugar transferase [Roseibium sp.]|uniref:sugar transferase n=1 Tax=Roseibium sp. TaxID=1936156 RepID=UPI003B51B653